MDDDLRTYGKYPLIDSEGVEWRMDSTKPISKIADTVIGYTPKETTASQLENIRDLLESGLFPDLSVKFNQLH